MKEMRRKVRMRIAKVAAVLLALLTVSCAPARTNETIMPDDGVFRIYYVSHDGNGIGAEPYEPVSDRADTEAMIEELIGELSANPLRLAYDAPMTGDIVLREYRLDESGLLTLDFDVRYLDMDPVTEILDRAAIVRTFSQIEGVTGVLFLVSGTSLMTSTDEPVGVMNADTFIYNAGREINTYDKIRITLYFADAEGTGLIPVYRTVVYHSNVSLERLVLEQLILGPYTEDAYAVVSPDVKISSVTMQDGVCYADVSEEFLTAVQGVAPETALYATVNSLCELKGVEQVHLYIGGDDQKTLADGTALTESFHKNNEIIVTQ